MFAKTARFLTRCRAWPAALAVVLGLSLPAHAGLTVDSGNGTVTDSTTQLMWDQCIVGRSGSDCLTDTASPRLYTWPAAMAAAVAANAANYKGHNDWRVPNVKELESITRLDTYVSGQAAIDGTAFPNTPIIGDDWDWGATWSSTTYSPFPDNAWIVVFSDGSSYASYKTNSFYVRLVRSGQSLASFDLLGSPPTVTGVNPSSASTLGGTLLTLTGSNFVTGATTVTLAGNACTSPSVASSTSMTCISPAGTAGSASVVATTANGSNAANSLFTYVSPTYTIGGNLSGLSGSVVLQNNLGDDLSLNANGAFTFGTAISSGAIYAVTVKTQPSGQTCSVSSGSGTATANVTNVAISCSTLPITTGPTVSSGPTQTGAGVSVTIDQAGTGYWLLVPSSAVAPSPAQVAAGVAYGSPTATVVAAGNTAMTAATPVTISLSGLTVATSYTLYFVAKDAAGNLQSAVASVAVTTAALSTQTISGFAPTSPVVFGTAPATLSATGGASGQPVVFATTSDATICTVSGSTVTFTGAGACNLTANQAAGGNFAAAPQATASISIVPAGQSIGSISFSPSALIVGGSASASASGGASGNPVIFSSATPSICSVSGNTVAALLQGTCTIAANQTGNTNYLAAPQVQGSLVIDPATVSYSLGVSTSDATGVVLASSTGHGGTAPYSLADLAPDTQVVLDAPAHTGSAIFLGWTGCDAVSAYSCTISMTAAKNVVAQYSALPPVIFEDDFAGSTLNTSKWRERRPSTGVISLSSGMVHLGVFSSAETCGKFAMLGDAPMVVEARFAGQGSGRDSVINLMGPATSGADFIQVGDTSYQDRGLYGNAAGSFAFDTVSGGPTTTAFKEYRVTLSGSLLTIARGDTLDTLTETAFAQLPRSAAGTSFFLRIGTGSELFSPADFDWIRVRGSHGTLHTGCPSDNLALPPQTIEFTNPGGKTLGSGSFLLVATGGYSGNAVTFESQTPAVCAVLANTTMLLTAGTCTITANQAGSETFAPAAPVTQSFEVSKAAQTIGTISFSPSTLAVGGSTAASATATSGLTVAFSSTTPTICSVSGNTVNALLAGTCTVAADQTGSETFAAAAQVTQSVEISKASQTIGPVTFPPSIFHVGTTTTASATASSGLSVTFGSSTPDICSVSGNTVTGVTAGTCTITADQPGNDTFAPAAQVVQTLAVAPANPTRLLNIATRGKVETVDNVMIAGFIIQGSSAKKVLIRARGPSLAAAPFNVPGTLADPFLTLYSGATPIDTNDDFAQHANAAQIPADWTPASAKEAAIVTTLSPGAYTAIVNGVGATSGVAIVEVFELDQPGTPLINIATRGPVQTG
jgi:hypothetical protein